MLSGKQLSGTFYRSHAIRINTHRLLYGSGISMTELVTQGVDISSFLIMIGTAHATLLSAFIVQLQQGYLAGESPKSESRSAQR